MSIDEKCVFCGSADLSKNHPVNMGFYTCANGKSHTPEQPVGLSSDEKCNRFSQWIRDNPNTPYSAMTCAVHAYFDLLGEDIGGWGEDPYHDNEAMRAALAATSKRESSDAWQPIESCPKVIHHSYLVYYEFYAYDDPSGMFCAAHYTEGKWINTFTQEPLRQEPKWWRDIEPFPVTLPVLEINQIEGDES